MATPNSPTRNAARTHTYHSHHTPHKKQAASHAAQRPAAQSGASNPAPRRAAPAGASRAHVALCDCGLPGMACLPVLLIMVWALLRD